MAQCILLSNKLLFFKKNEGKKKDIWLKKLKDSSSTSKDISVEYYCITW